MDPSRTSERACSPTCSPRTRGWTLADPVTAESVPLLPAHAGMDPLARAPGRASGPAPRARGDGPPWKASRSPPQLLLPAHAGMDPRSASRRCCRASAPRARGDGPISSQPVRESMTCSPRTRGWTHPGRSGRRSCRLLPAHAGMDPDHRAEPPAGSPAPRARGDGPRQSRKMLADLHCSPRMRGSLIPPDHPQLSPHEARPAPPRHRRRRRSHSGRHPRHIVDP